MHTLVATITPLAEYRDAVRDALLATVEQVHLEDGCELYALHQTPEKFVIIECWANTDAHLAHKTNTPIAQLLLAIDGKLAAPLDVIVLEPLPSSDRVKGQLT